MSSCAPASVFTNQHFRSSATITEYSINTKCNASFICKNPCRGRRYLSVSEDSYKVRRVRITGVIKSARGLSNLQAQQETWEEPDDGSGSEYDEEEEEQMEDENFGFESDWEEEEKTTSAVNDVTSADKYGEKIKKEIEQLLEPEERAVLQQNVTPNLEKISTLLVGTCFCSRLRLPYLHSLGKMEPTSHISVINTDKLHG